MNTTIRKTTLPLLCVLLLTTALTACGKNTSEEWLLGQPLDREKLVVGVIYVDDAASGYSFAHETGIREMSEKLGLYDGQVIRKFNVIDADSIMVEAMIREAIAEGANLIVATSWGQRDACEKLAAEYPNIIFANASGDKSNDTNFTNYFGRIYQARYFSGVAAGLKTRTGKIGYVAAMDSSNSEVTGGLDAFAIGVESVNPDAKIYARVTYSWYDPAGEREAARGLIAAGCDIIAQHCDTPKPQIEAEANSVWGIGYNSDMSVEAPAAVLTSVIWNWGAYYTFLAQSVIDGTFTTEPYFGGLADGMVDITPLAETLAEPGMKEAVEAARNRVENGFNVFDGAMETNDGRKIGTEGGTLSDGEITGGIHWYYRNVEVLP
jgi:basic membrane protein A